MAFFECQERGRCLALEAEGGGDFGPVEFGGGGTLLRDRVSCKVADIMLKQRKTR